MRLTALLSTTTALLSGLAAPALADVTPEDVWQNTRAYMESFGGSMTGDLVPAGKALMIENWGLSFALPMGLGTVGMTVSDGRLIDNGDGTVTLRYPDGTLLGLTADIPGEFSGGVTMAFTGGDVDMVASGAPGDISYAYDIDSYTIEFLELTADTSQMSAGDAAMFNSVEIGGTVSVAGNTGTMRVTEGDLVTTLIDGAYSAVDYNITFAMDDLVSGFQTGTVGPGTSEIQLSLPAGGAALMQLPAALRAGMSMDATYQSDSSTSNQEILSGGELFGYTRQETGAVEGVFRFDADGLGGSATMAGFDIDTLDPEIGLPIMASIAKLSYELAMPLMASDAQQPFTYAFDLAGIEVDESLWGLFDPAAALPRDPADLRMTLTGLMGTTMDLLDFAAWEQVESMDPIPFSLHEATITDLYVNAVGVTAEGSADFTFDMTDLESFDGFPAPSGSANLAVTGANGLIDTLIGMGLLSSEDAMGARMGMSMFTQPGEGEDSLTSEVQVDGASGSVSVNGMRIR